MLDDALIRPAEPADAQEIAMVNHRTWIETYRGILDETAIQAHSLEEQVQLWRDQLAWPNPSERRFVAVAAGQVVGYAGGGRNPDRSSPFQAELFGIYVLRDYQGKGLGTRLMRALAAWLKEQGHASMLAWILPQNPYRRFYEKLGARLLDGTREVEYSGKRLQVACYG